MTLIHEEPTEADYEGTVVVVVGNPMSGFAIFGPFSSSAAAREYIKAEVPDDDTPCICPLNEPEQSVVDE
jgi:hypothetical protein